MSTYITGGTLDEDGKTTIYTDAEKDAARDKAKKDAEKLAAGKYSSVEEFDKAIAALEVNKDNKNVTSSESKNILYDAVEAIAYGDMTPAEAAADTIAQLKELEQ